MKTLARPALLSAATSISTMAGVRIRALTERHPIKPTSPRCHSAWQLNLGRHSTYRRGKSVQTTGTTSFRYKLLNPICMWLKRESLVPAELVWTDTARFALTLDESANSTQSHVVQLGNFHTAMTGFDCRNDTFAQIVGIRLPHSRLAPFAPVGILNPIRAVM